jgi:hypothetical protein
MEQMADTFIAKINAIMKEIFGWSGDLSIKWKWRIYKTRDGYWALEWPRWGVDGFLGHRETFIEIVELFDKQKATRA